RRALPAGRGNAGRADAARRRVRIPGQGRGLAPRAVELAVLVWLVPRIVRARADARPLRHRLPSWIRLLRVRDAGGRVAVRRLRAAGGDVAHIEDRRRAAEKGARLG